MIKQIHQSALLGFLVFSIYSCHRAVETESTKLSIQLPGMSNSSAKINSSNIDIIQSLKVSILSSNVTEGESSEQNNENFLDILPTGYDNVATPTNYPINCYLVGITGPESFLQKNSCGIKNATGQVDANYKFGTFIGLRPSGAVLELDAVPGDNRQVYIFGLHSTSAAECKDFANKPSKNNFSKPHILGTSAALKFEAGKSITVPINLAMPSHATQLDDCEINNDQSKQNLIADTVSMYNQSFPFNNLRLPISANTTCEPLDIQFRNSTDNSRQALLANSGTLTMSYTVSGDPTIYNSDIYQDFQTCNNSASGGSVNIPSSFITVSAGSSFIRVWTPLANNGASIYSYKPSVANLTSIASQYFADLQTLRFTYHTTLPRQIDSLNPQCLNFMVTYRNIYGEIPVSATSSFDATAVDGNLNTIGDFYSDANCSTASSSFQLSSPSDNKLKNIYFKLRANVTNNYVNIKLRRTDNLAMTVGYETLDFFQQIQIRQKPTDYISTISQFRARTISSLPSRKSNTTSLCNPIDVQALDQNGFLIAASTIDKIEIDPADIPDLKLATDSSCMSPMTVADGKYTQNFSANSSSLRFYVETGSAGTAGSLTPTTTYGLHQMTIILNSGIKRTLSFTIRNPYK